MYKYGRVCNISYLLNIVTVDIDKLIDIGKARVYFDKGKACFLKINKENNYSSFLVQRCISYFSMSISLMDLEIEKENKQKAIILKVMNNLNITIENLKKLQ